MKFSIALAIAISAIGLLPAAASAHVTIQPSSAPADGFTRVNVRVPSEEADANTTNVAVKFPSGIYFASYEAVPGWKVAVTNKKLAAPVKMGDDETTEEVTGVTFTATGGGLKPGEFQDFGLSISTPSKAGTTLTFPAVQSYSNGDIVRWIGAPDAEQPAPRLALTAAVPEGQLTTPTATTTPQSTSSTSAVAWIALVLGALGLLLAGAAFVGSRKKS